jgi:hypothetical protein
MTGEWAHGGVAAYLPIRQDIWTSMSNLWWLWPRQFRTSHGTLGQFSATLSRIKKHKKRLWPITEVNTTVDVHPNIQLGTGSTSRNMGCPHIPISQDETRPRFDPMGFSLSPFISFPLPRTIYLEDGLIRMIGNENPKMGTMGIHGHEDHVYGS